MEAAGRSLGALRGGWRTLQSSGGHILGSMWPVNVN